MKHHKLKGFTLVELIVVITILAILGAIAFISLQGYSKSARDSTRISDVKTIKTALELFSLETGFYPEPSNGTGVTFSGSEVWTQGVIGDSVISLLQRIDEKPVDPLTANEYTYSRLNTKKEFELATVFEDSNVALNTNQVQAEGNKQGTAHVSGTYNSVTSKVKIGNTYYLLALPSIIATDLSLTQIEDIVDNNKFVYNGYKNLPANYSGTNYNLNGEENLNLVNTLVVYTGSTLPDTSSQYAQFAGNLQAAYSGTLLKDDGNYTYIVNINTTDQVALENLGKTIFNTALGGKEKISTNTSITPQEIPLYDFTSHTFTNCGQTGRTGPSLTQCTNSYDTTWDSNPDYFTMNTQGIQEWTIPETGIYRIEAVGAAGGKASNYSYLPGMGVKMVGDFTLNKGDKLKVLVGQLGPNGTHDGGGGGGTFITDISNTALIVAGGGGGGSYSSLGIHATIGEGGTGGQNGGEGGIGGNGGLSSGYAGAGAGINGNGGNGNTSNGGFSFVNGGYGGTTSNNATGGFGGGGGTHGGGWGGGGGGGYSGGGASISSQYGGGGGGSYNSGTNQNNGGYNGGHGYVKILLGGQTSCPQDYILNNGFCVENKFHGDLENDLSGWTARTNACSSCLDGYTKRFGQMSLIECEVLAAKHKATMFYADYYQHPSTGSDSWRWRIDGDYGVRSSQHPTHYEYGANNSDKYCSLYKWGGSDISAGAATVSESLDYETPFIEGSFTGYKYRVYRQSVPGSSQNYYCSTWLRKFGLQMYTMGVQQMLQNTTGGTGSSGNGGLCTHGNCGDSYSYLSSKTYSDVYSYSGNSHWRDGYCYGYTIWGNE